MDVFKKRQLIRLGIDIGDKDENQSDRPCPSCHRVFASYQGLRCHEHQAHGQLHVSSGFAVVVVGGFGLCTCCLVGFMTKNNLVRHFKSHKRCLDFLRYAYPHGLGSDPEVLKGIPLQNANQVDGVQAYGPRVNALEDVYDNAGGAAVVDGFVRPDRMSTVQAC